MNGRLLSGKWVAPLNDRDWARCSLAAIGTKTGRSAAAPVAVINPISSSVRKQTFEGELTSNRVKAATIISTRPGRSGLLSYRGIDRRLHHVNEHSWIGDLARRWQSAPVTSRPSISTLAGLAELAGVSVATVSRSLSGNKAIADVTRNRIVELAREHGFQINQAARNLRLKRTGSIGVVLPLGHEQDQHLSDPFFMSLLAPLADAIADRGHDLLLSRVIPRDERWLDSIVDAGRVDGVVIIGQSNQIETIERIAGRYRPLVVWGAAMPGKGQLTVGSDNFAGGRIAAEHLLAQGRKRLAFFGNIEVPEFAARYAGFQQALAEAGGGQATLLPVHLTSESSYSAIESYLTGHPSPDGIVAASDVIAMSALRALAGHGKRVPQDVGVVGYDDVQIAMHTTPPLTTVRQDVARGAETMIDLLFRRIDGEDVRSVAMVPELILRASA